MRQLLVLLFLVAASAVSLAGEPRAQAAYPGNNGKILYQDLDPNTFESEIWVMDANGTGKVNITNTPDDQESGGVWSPDGTKIAFVSNREAGNVDIWVMDADGGNPIRLTDDAGGDSDPTWSPDGMKIAFGANRDGDGDVFVMDADGANETDITNTAGVGEGEPTWSPDGTKIAYRYSTPSPGTCWQEIHVMDANGANQTPLTCQITARTPDWSPDGTKIVFGVGIGTGVSVWTMNADGSAEDEIAVAPAIDPAWSPDATKVLFEAVRPAGIGLFTIDPNGTNEALLSQGASGGNWQPLPPPPDDADGDGVPDDTDNCPTVSNAAGQAADVDGDLAGDACDGPGSGNVDCSGPSGVNAVDALWVLRWGAGLPMGQSEPCLDVGQPRALAPPDDWKMGDVNCSGGVNSVDALFILRANAGLSLSNMPVGCPAIKPV